MKITLETVSLAEKFVLARLMELYEYDFSEYSKDDVDESGCFGYAHLDDYWREQGRHAFFIRVDGRLAGFVMVRSCWEYQPLQNPRNIAEFFVMKKYRRQGVGRVAAMATFDRFPGGWEVSQWSSNVSAQRFWQKVIAEYTGGRYATFTMAEKGVVGLTFDNSQR